MEKDNKKEIEEKHEKLEQEYIKEIKDLFGCIIDKKTGYIDKQGLAYIIEGMNISKNPLSIIMLAVTGVKAVNESNLSYQGGDKLLSFFNKDIMPKLTRFFPESLVVKFKYDSLCLITERPKEEIEALFNIIEVINNEVNTKYFIDRDAISDMKINYSSNLYRPGIDDTKTVLDDTENKLVREKEANVNIYKYKENGKEYLVKADQKDNKKIGIYEFKDVKFVDLENSNNKHTLYDTAAISDNKEVINIIKAILNNDDNYFKNLESIDKLKGMYEQLYKAIFEDSLTHMKKKKYVDEILCLNNNIKNYIGKSFTLFDVNNLRKTNLVKGEKTGNELLAKFAEFSKEVYKDESDLLIRYGGDEFLFICDAETAEEKLKCLFEKIDEFERNPDKKFDLKVSHAYAIYDGKEDFESFKKDELEKQLKISKQEMKKCDPKAYLVINAGAIVATLTNCRTYEELVEPIKMYDGFSEVPNSILEEVKLAVLEYETKKIETNNQLEGSTNEQVNSAEHMQDL